jgi:hypothetical protein
LVTEGLPDSAWQWIAELPDGVVVGELRAVRGVSEPGVVLVRVVRCGFRDSGRAFRLARRVTQG